MADVQGHRAATHPGKLTQRALDQSARLRRSASSGTIIRPEQRVVLAAIQRASSWLESVLRQTTVLHSPQVSDASEAAKVPQLTQVMIKPCDDLCNLKCSYCYERSAGSTASARMTDEVLERIIRQVLELGATPLLFSCIGGEPLMVAREWFEKCVKYQKSHNSRGRVIRNTVQTNGSLLTAEWADFFSTNDFRVGVSIDAPEELHDKHRAGAGGLGSFRSVMRGIECLKEKKVPFAAMAVLTNDHEGRAQEILRTFRDAGISTVRLAPQFTVYPDATFDSIAPRVYRDLMIELFDAWLSSGDENMQISHFEDVFHALLGLPPTTCQRCLACARILGFSSSGDAISCSRLRAANARSFGNIRQQTLRSILISAPYHDFIRESTSISTACSACAWFHMCGGGCFASRVRRNRFDATGTSAFCSAYRAIYRHITVRVEATLAA
jgi:uncharacterized protein